jgi:hypothetical protein
MYFKLKLSSDPKIIGVRNGIYQVELMEKVFTKEYLKKLDSYFHTGSSWTLKDALPDFSVYFQFKKLKLTKETNFMSFCPHFNNCLFLIDDRSLKLLESFNIQSHQLYPSIISDPINSEEIHSYKMFFALMQDYDIVDFSKSVFYTGGYGNVALTDHQFSNGEEMRNFRPFPQIKVLALNNEFDSKLDLFYSRIGGIFISEKLRSALEQNGVTGLEFDNSVEVIF